MWTPNRQWRIRTTITGMLVLTTAVAIGLNAVCHRPDAAEKVYAFYDGRGLTEDNALKDPVGYQRCYSFLASDGYICNGGFYGAFHDPLSHPLLLPLIEFFDQLELNEIADIIRSAAIVFRDDRTRTGDLANDKLSQFDFNNFVPLSRNLVELDSLYFSAREDLDIPDLVNKYWRRNPEHFK